MDDVALAELREFIAIPSISADPAHREDVSAAGEWAAEFIRSKLGGTAQLTPWGEKELVLGEVPASNDPQNSPTVLVRMRCLSAVLAGENGLLPEPLRVGIVAPTAEELANWEALPSGAEELELAGARPLDPNAAEQFNIRTLAAPSADVNGIIGG